MEQIIHAVQDMTHLSWSNIGNSSGTAGSFLKSQEVTPHGKIYYKLSAYDSIQGVYGHESVNEIIADRLLTVLGIPHLNYQLIHADILIDGKTLRTWLCASSDFRKRGEQKLALDIYYENNRKSKDETPMAFCLRHGWDEYIYRMLVFDYLILNRDRHGANMEVLVNRSTKTVRLAPLFDHGVSFFSRTFTKEALEKEDVMDDKAIQCFVGSRSAAANLSLIPTDRRPLLIPLKESDRSILLGGLEDALDPLWLERSWEMVWRRWLAYEAFCNKR